MVDIMEAFGTHIGIRRSSSTLSHEKLSGGMT
jgi:hypothetical protein